MPESGMLWKGQYHAVQTKKGAGNGKGNEGPEMRGAKSTHYLFIST